MRNKKIAQPETIVPYGFLNEKLPVPYWMTLHYSKKEIPYKEGRMKDIGDHVGYTILWGRVSKVVRDGVQMCYYPAARQFMRWRCSPGLAWCGSYVW